MKISFPHYQQLDIMDCDPTFPRIIAKYYDKNYSLQTLCDKNFITRKEVFMLSISNAIESIGFKITFDQLVNNIKLPYISHWNQNHFVACCKIKRREIIQL